MKAEFRDGNFIITIPAQKPRLTASGKCWIVAQTPGCKWVKVKGFGGKSALVGVVVCERNK